ncbi:MAG: N,N-dimethylformamidase beta subunit family domain-containing protein [Isosphaeraceae bacterium]
MRPPDRREFMKTASAALAAGAIAHTAGPATGADAAVAASPAEIPPHRPLPLLGVHAYADRVSVPAGGTIRFFVSSTMPYEFQICRLGTDPEGPDGDQVLQSFSVDRPVAQAIHPGSYIHIDRGLPPDRNLPALSLECWVRLWDLAGEQGLMGQFDATEGGGYALAVRRDGSVGFYLGDGGPPRPEWLHRTESRVVSRTETTPPAVPTPTRPAGGGRFVKLSRWHHVAAVFDGQFKEVWVDGRRAGRWRFSGTVRPGLTPLRIGALGRDGLADQFLDADIAMPAIYGRALDEREIVARHRARGLDAAKGPNLLGCWPLAEEKGDQVADSSGQRRHGRIINRGTWMIGGPSFDASLPRFADYEPAADRTRGHGLRLASDDLYDCRWQPTFTVKIPDDARSGIYAGRIRFNHDDKPRLYHALFIVTKAPGRARAPIAFLCSTNTWKAYSGTPFAETWRGVAQSIEHAYVNSPGNPPRYSFYWMHEACQSTFQMGMRLPWPVAGPYTFHGPLEWRNSHLCHTDRLTEVWLEKEGYAYDVLSDLDLHQDPSALDGYKTLFIVGHSEYWSAEAYESVSRYLRRGGSVVCLAGNTMFWRVSFDADASVMECRKMYAPGSQVAPGRHGELWHSQDGRKGGMARECGYPAWPLLGLEYCSMHSVGDEAIGPYRAVAADHFLFNEPHKVGMKEGDRFGGAPPGNGFPKVIGHEGDVRISTLAKIAPRPLPEGAKEPVDDPPGIVLIAEGIADWQRVKGGAPYDYFQNAVVVEPLRSAIGVAAEMIYWERPHGGRVFHAGTVSAGRGLGNDPKFALLIKNVLDHFGVKPGHG